jgi:hypothetical protein
VLASYWLAHDAFDSHLGSEPGGGEGLPTAAVASPGAPRPPFCSTPLDQRLKLELRRKSCAGGGGSTLGASIVAPARGGGNTVVERLVSGGWQNPAKLQRQHVAAASMLSIETLQHAVVTSVAARRLAHGSTTGAVHGGQGRALDTAGVAAGMVAGLVPPGVNRSMLDEALVLGQVASKFILLRCGSVLLAADQHAVDERIRYERLTATLLAVLPPSPPQTAGQVGGCAALGSVALSTSQVVSLSHGEAAAWHAHRGVVQRWGWWLEVPAASQADGRTKFTLTHVPLVVGAQLNATDLRVSGGRLARDACRF